MFTTWKRGLPLFRSISQNDHPFLAGGLRLVDAGQQASCRSLTPPTSRSFSSYAWPSILEYVWSLSFELFLSCVHLIQPISTRVRPRVQGVTLPLPMQDQGSPPTPLRNREVQVLLKTLVKDLQMQVCLFCIPWVQVS